MPRRPTHEQGAERGVVFPEVAGRRSTSATARGVFADAVRAVDRDVAAGIEAELAWRKHYPRHLRRLVELGVRSPADALTISRDGLASLHRRFRFAGDGEECGLAEAFASADGKLLHTAVVEGRGSRLAGELSVPYHGSRLRGGALHRQLDDWVTRGIVEPSFAEAIRLVVANPDWLDLAGTTVAVVGAGAEMGPLRSLCRWGATVAPVDLPSAPLWERVLGAVRDGCGRAYVPVREPGVEEDALASVAGADLLTEAPEVAAWLGGGLDGPLVLGNYVYADGATNVRVSMAVDAVTVELLGQRNDVALAFLCTPTDVFAVPTEAVEESRRRYDMGGVGAGLRHPVRLVSGRRLLLPHYPSTVPAPDGREVGVADCLVLQQGPNYALAKRLQRWRASVARDEGTLVSANVAPPTRTRSVLKNRVLAAAYAGSRPFGLEVFEPSTSNTLMAALLVHDLRNATALGNPATSLPDPLELFRDGACHGGLWRSAYLPRSVLGIAAVLGMFERRA